MSFSPSDLDMELCCPGFNPNDPETTNLNDSDFSLLDLDTQLDHILGSDDSVTVTHTYTSLIDDKGDVDLFTAVLGNYHSRLAFVLSSHISSQTCPFDSAGYILISKPAQPVPTKTTPLHALINDPDTPHVMRKNDSCDHDAIDLDIAHTNMTALHSGFPGTINGFRGSKIRPAHLSHSLLFRRLLTELDGIYDTHANGCEVCFYKDKMYELDRNKECSKDLSEVFARNLCYNELGIWESTPLPGEAGRSKAIDEEAELKPTRAVIDIKDPENPSCQYIHPTYKNNISLFTAALNCQNYTAFDMILNKCQEVFGYVSASILFDLLECAEYDLYHYITDYSTKLINTLQNKKELAHLAKKTSVAPRNDEMVKKYKHITFTPPNNFLQPPLLISPVTRVSAVVLLLKKCTVPDSEKIPTHQIMLADLLQFHINYFYHASLCNSGFSITDTCYTEKIEEDKEEISIPFIPESTAVDYLQNHFPAVVPFVNFWHPASLAYVSSRTMFAVGLQVPHQERYSQIEDNYEQPFFYNEFLMARHVAPIITRYLWLIDLLHLPYHRIATAALKITNFNQIFANIPMAHFYAVLMHQPIPLIGKWLYLVIILCRPMIADLPIMKLKMISNLLGNNRPRYTQRFTSSRIDLLVTLLYNFILYAIPFIYPTEKSHKSSKNDDNDDTSTVTHEYTNDFLQQVYPDDLTEDTLTPILNKFDIPHVLTNELISHVIDAFDKGNTESGISFPSLYTFAGFTPLSRSDLMHIKLLIAALFFPAEIPLYHTLTHKIDTYNGPKDLTIYQSHYPLLSPSLQVAIFSQLITPSHYSGLVESYRYGLDDTINTIITITLDPTLYPRLLLFLLNYYAYSPLCTLRDPSGLWNDKIISQAEKIDKQVLLKAEVLRRCHLSNNDSDYDPISFWSFLRLTSHVGDDYDSLNISSRDIDTIDVPKLLSCDQRLPFQAVQTYRLPCLAEDEFFDAGVILDHVAMDTVAAALFTKNAFHLSTFLNESSLSDYLRRLYEFNKDFDYKYDPYDYYRVMEELTGMTVDQLTGMISSAQLDVLLGNLDIQAGQSDQSVSTNLPMNPLAMAVFAFHGQYHSGVATPAAARLFQVLYADTIHAQNEMKKQFITFMELSDILGETLNPPTEQEPCQSFMSQILTHCHPRKHKQFPTAIHHNIDRIPSFANLPQKYYQTFVLSCHLSHRAPHMRLWDLIPGQREHSNRILPVPLKQNETCHVIWNDGVITLKASVEDYPTSYHLFCLKAMCLTGDTFHNFADAIVDREWLRPIFRIDEVIAQPQPQYEMFRVFYLFFVLYYIQRCGAQSSDDDELRDYGDLDEDEKDDKIDFLFTPLGRSEFASSIAKMEETFRTAFHMYGNLLRLDKTTITTHYDKAPLPSQKTKLNEPNDHQNEVTLQLSGFIPNHNIDYTPSPLLKADLCTEEEDEYDFKDKIMCIIPHELNCDVFQSFQAQLPMAFFHDYAEIMDTTSSSPGIGCPTIINPTTNTSVETEHWVVTFSPMKILLSMYNPATLQITNMPEIVNREYNKRPLSFFNADNTGINEVFTNIDTIEKLWMLYYTMDPNVKAFFDNIHHMF